MTGAEFKAKRGSLGWTQKQAAEALGLGVAAIAAIENGRTKSVAGPIERLMSFYRLGDAPGRPSSLEHLGTEWARVFRD